MIKNDLARFWSKVNKTETCWLWTAAKTGKGYGCFYAEGRNNNRAHRWIIQTRLKRKLRPDEFVCHKCDVPLCVRPGHLFISDNSGNQQDMVRKGKHWRDRQKECPTCGEPYSYPTTTIAKKLCYPCRRKGQRKYAAKMKRLRANS